VAPVPFRIGADRGYRTIVQFTEMPHGGHFPAVEAVDLLAADIRSAGPRRAAAQSS
jgi:hypothetical protein